MNLLEYLLSFIIFSVFIIGITMIIGDINYNYEGIMHDNISTSNFKSTYNSINYINNISQEQSAQIIGKELDTTNVVDSVYSGSYSALRIIGGTFSLAGNLINDLAIALGIPEVFIIFAITALTISIIFGIISIILRMRWF